MILTVTLNPCIDHTLFVHGLKPHDSNKVDRIETDAGGKGINLSRMVAELDGDTVATGFLGGETGDFILSVLTSKGVGTDFVQVNQPTRTNLSVESGDGPPTVFSAKGPKVSEQEWESLILLVRNLAQSSSWVALGGSLPPGVPDDSYKVLGDIVKQSGSKLMIDADGAPMRLGLEAGPDLIKPNKDETERLLGRNIESLEDALDCATQLRESLVAQGSADAVAIVSLGSQGAVLCSGKNLLYGVPPTIKSNSTIGSGDSFLGGLLVSKEAGHDESDGLRAGIAAGAATAGSDGTRLGTKAEFLALKDQCVVVTAEEAKRMTKGGQVPWPNVREPSSGP